MSCKKIQHVSSTKLEKNRKCGAGAEYPCGTQDPPPTPQYWSACPRKTKSSDDESVKRSYSGESSTSRQSSPHIPPCPPIPPPKKFQNRKPLPFKHPRPYTFRIPISASMTGDVKKGIVKSPPFYLLLDHTLAVVWSLFSKDEIERPLGIVQLQWALSFLKGIHNRKGEHPKDVEVCIQAIQDQLIDQYASLIDDIRIAPKKPCCTCETREKEGIVNQSRSLLSTSTHPSRMDASMFTMSKSVPFSVNYAEMIEHNPPNVEQLYPCTNNDQSDPLSILKSSSKSKDFLQTIRKEQLDKIQQELKTLHLIEDYIANADNPDGLAAGSGTQILTTDRPGSPASSGGSPKRSKIPKKTKQKKNETV